MAKKKNKQTEMMESAHRIWLAGLGALSAAEEEGGKLFKNLVKKGEEFETKSRSQVEKMVDKVGETKTKAEGVWEMIGDSFDEKVTTVLHTVGVPTRDEIAMLTKRVEELTTAVENLKPAKPAAKAAAKPAAKPAAKKTTTRTTTKKAASTAK